MNSINQIIFQEMIGNEFFMGLFAKLNESWSSKEIDFWKSLSEVHFFNSSSTLWKIFLDFLFPQEKRPNSESGFSMLVKLISFKFELSFSFVPWRSPQFFFPGEVFRSDNLEFCDLFRGRWGEFLLESVQPSLILKRILKWQYSKAI